jgi:hypothetical protein
MAAYPFMSFPRYPDFLAQLTSLGVKIKETEVTLGKGEVQKIGYLENTADGKVYYFPLNFASEADIVQPPVMRSVIRALKLDPTSFGLHLDAPLITEE